MRTLGLLLGAALALSGCKKEGCLAAADGEACTVPSPCRKLSLNQCAPGAAGSVEARALVAGDVVPGGLDALGAPGDVLLGNDQVVAVIDALDKRHFIAPSGGNIIDLGTRDAGKNRDDDSFNLMIQAVGILPGDEVNYTSLEILSSGPDLAAVQVRGALLGRPQVKVATRYEVRPCEPGLRIRTEYVNRGPDAELWMSADALYWSGREALPFTPAAGHGFAHKSFNLLTIGDAFETLPFVAASGHSTPAANYALVGCNVSSIEGFQSDQVSSAGPARRIVPARDYVVFERFLAAAPGADVSRAAGVALLARGQLFGEASALLKGRTVRVGGAPVGGAEVEAMVIATDENHVPWNQVVPGADGAFEFRVPANHDYTLTVRAFAHDVASATVHVGTDDTAAPDIAVPLVGSLTLTVTDAATGQPTDARVVLVPSDAATAAATSGESVGYAPTGSFQPVCAPLLGPPNGPSPACNQILVRAGPTPTKVDVPSGNYHVYATAGPFATLAHQLVSVKTSDVPVTLSVQALAVQPAGTLSADFHVHGRPSFDSSIPDLDRALAFSAARVDVIAATDHDAVGNYDAAMTALGLSSKITVLGGLETTGHTPWFTNPGSILPRVIGHWLFWPVQYDPAKPRRGAPDDEFIEPGELFDRVRPITQGKGVIALPHPWGEAYFGRDIGYPRALGMDCTKPIPASDDGSVNARFARTPPGASTASLAYDAQEVMNGSRNSTHLPYRAFWFYLLNQGIVKVGLANSDSHGLSDNVLGTPRNVIPSATLPPNLDVEAMDAAVRGGRVLGTNGPIIEATLKAADGTETPPSVTPVTPASGTVLHIKVRAAPWVPVQEVRIVVNGRVAKTLTMVTPAPADPFGAVGLDRLDTTVALADVLPADNRDSWIVVEAGAPLQLAGDLDGDGIPDTTDNNGDGVVDLKDVDTTGGATTGPLNDPPLPKDPSDLNYHFAQVTNGGLPQAFTNPFLLDRDGKPGFGGPGLGGGK